MNMMWRSGTFASESMVMADTRTEWLVYIWESFAPTDIVFTTGMVFCCFLVGHHCVLAATDIARDLKTVAAKISLAFSSTPAPVKRNVEPRSSQQSGWSCHTEEWAGSNFSKVRWYNNFLCQRGGWFWAWRLEFCCCFEILGFLYFHCNTVVV